MRNPFKKRNPYQLTEDLLKANPDAKSYFDMVGSKAALRQYMGGVEITFTEDSTEEVAKIASTIRSISTIYDYEPRLREPKEPFFDKHWHVPFYVRYKLEQRRKRRQRFFRKLFGIREPVDLNELLGFKDVV